ncbi:extracellular solute-binding protein [Flavivirga eckloniae]|uniref:ABC transporter substrate-binding protein n=1 Tax=Flavivirga eckloniae TaxID=1803846 RepID=A0A2K9PR27_9FLAO|nr:extracellular solute-binding protein [Flavivirga eckloniae]AUP79522.1 ABC transporter substrate-binding protein [Flavivirga eckloniae]
MSKKITLKGIAWDHPRGYEPLRATSKEFTKIYPEVTINWDIRSLKEFGDMPIENLIDTYDVITIDHPYMGQAYTNKLLLPLNEQLSEGVLKELGIQSVGASFKSYNYNGDLYALPIDAAALVSVSRADLVAKLNLELPKTRTGLLNFYQKVPNEYKVAWALCPTDLWCAFLTLCAQDSGGDFISEAGVDESIGSAVLRELKHHLKFAHPESINWNPIQILDSMGSDNTIIYSPYLFGYTNYSRAGYSKNILCFGNSPTNPKTKVSSILGGVGLAVSSKCEHPALAAAYVSYTAKAETQEGVYTKNGGQPGNLVAWKSEDNNKLCNNFFKDTLETMENAYVRPQYPGWNQFQEQGADILHNGIVKDISSDKLMKELNKLYQSIV